MVLPTTERSIFDEISHYEVLSYNSTNILKQCEQYRSPNSALQSKMFINLFFIAMDRYILFYFLAGNSLYVLCISGSLILSYGQPVVY